MTINEAILLAHGIASTIYGFSEKNCGDVGHARACDNTAITASGEHFDPSQPSAAVPAPFDLPIEARWIYLRTAHSDCVRVRLNDKKNPRFLGTSGFDLSPAAVALLTGKPPSRTWSDKIYVCNRKQYKDPHWDKKVPVSRQIVDVMH